MIDMLLATLGFGVIAVLGSVALVSVTVLPWYVALQMAEARSFSPARWAAISLAGVAVGLALAYLLRGRDGLPSYVAAVPLALTWAGPGLLWLLDAGEDRIGGRAGLHE